MKEGNVVQHHGLYRSEFEHDNCGIGAIVNIKGQKSHDTVANALKIVENLEHRAGKDAEGKTGDGVGILLQVSHRFFSKVCKPLGIFLGSEREYGIGMFFFPQDELKKNQAKKMCEIIVEKEGLKFLHNILTPYEFEVTIIAERGFKSIDLFKFIDETLKWKYCIICTKDMGISIAGKRKIKKLDDITPRKGFTKYF